MAQHGLTEFIQHIKKNGVVRSNKYRIDFGIPQRVLNAVDVYAKQNNQQYQDMFSNETSTILSITCVRADIPGYQLVTAENGYGNFLRKTVYDKINSDFESVFLMTANGVQRKLFEIWMHLIVRDMHRIEYYDEYISEVVITLLDSFDNELYSVRLTEAYPTTVTPVNMNRQEENGMLEFQVNWAFHKTSTIEINLYQDLDTLNASDLADADFSVDQLNDFIASDGYKGEPFTRIDNVEGIMSSNPVTGVVDTVTNVATPAMNKVNDTLKNATTQVNNVLTQVKQGEAHIQDGMKIVKKIISDIKTDINIPIAKANAVVDKINKAVSNVTKEIPGLDQKVHKLPSIKLPSSWD